MTGPQAQTEYPAMGYPATGYPVQFSVDYPDRALSRLSTAFRLILVLPIAIVLAAVSGYVVVSFPNQAYGVTYIVIRWNVRVTAYTLTLVTDRYPPFRLAP